MTRTERNQKKNSCKALGAMAAYSLLMAVLLVSGCGRGSLLGVGGDSAAVTSGGGSGLAAPTSLTYTLHSATYINGATILNNSPTTDGLEVTYSIVPNITVNTGLSFSTTTGIISGTPSINSAVTSYTVTATNVAGFVDRVLSIGTANGYIVSSTADTGDFATADGFCDTNDSVGDGPCTLRAAIEQANFTGGTRAISVPAGTVTVNGTTIAIGSAGLASLTVTGQGSGSTIISGGGSAPRIFSTSNATNVTFASVTLSDGSEGADGAALIHNSTGVLTVSDSIIDDNHTTVSGAAAIAVLDGSANFTNTTISNNSSMTSGGGIGVYHAVNPVPVTFTNCIFSGNHAEVDGGAYWSHNTTTITDTTFTGNTADTNAGAIFHDAGTLTITGSTFSGNSVPAGVVGGTAGALRAQNDATVTITDTTFEGNIAVPDTASRSGGAIYFVGLTAAPAVLNRVTFYNNNSDFGGGLAQENGTTNMTNCTFSENDALMYGGAIALNNGGAGATINIRQSTIANNDVTAAAAGGGIGVSTAGATVNLSQSIIARNRSNAIVYNCMATGGSTIVAGSYNLFDTDNTDCPVNTGGGTPDIQNANVSSLASNVADNGGDVFTLAVSSGTAPMVDAIPGGSCFSAIDARQTARPQGAGCDIGAFEF